MGTHAIKSSTPVGPGQRDPEDRLFTQVVIASLLLHAVTFAVLLYYEERLRNEPPRLIMADMVTLPSPEPKSLEVATPPAPVKLPLPKTAVKTTAPTPATVVRSASPPPAPAYQPVLMAPLGEAKDLGRPSVHPEMVVPVAPPPVRKPAQAPEAASSVAQTLSVKPASPDLTKARISYRAQIAALIDRNKEYPLFARKAGQQGTCSIRCTMMCDGTVKKVELVKSSGYDALDKAGLRAVNSVGKFPPPPHDGGCIEVSFEVPITFRLG